MNPPEVEYILSQIRNHARIFFDFDIETAFNESRIRFVPTSALGQITDRAVAIPFDIPIPETPETPYRVRFNGTEVTLWNRVPPPETGEWYSVPNDDTPLWYENRHGTLTPAWNVFGNLFDLLTFGEDRRSDKRDVHGRFVGGFSPRAAAGLLEVPAFNEAVAVLVAACHGIQQSNKPTFRLGDVLKPPVVVLSHDCDILLGNDIWTQTVRASRVLLPPLSLKAPKIGNLWWILRNAATPRRYYFDNVTGMIDLERCFGFRSTFYLLNGSGGRFGARSGIEVIPDLISKVPSEWDIGIHYNYDTYLDEERFSAQLKELGDLLGSRPVVGRAHYLRFDGGKSLGFLQNFGIRVDESSGYSDRIGFRNGIGGCFQGYDPESNEQLDIFEVPLTILEATLVGQYGSDAIRQFSRTLKHLGSVGGALTLLYHPGVFFNPEHRDHLGLYHKMLMECRDQGAVSRTARSLVDEIM